VVLFILFFQSLAEAAFEDVPNGHLGGPSKMALSTLKCIENSKKWFGVFLCLASLVSFPPKNTCLTNHPSIWRLCNFFSLKKLWGPATISNNTKNVETDIHLTKTKRNSVSRKIWIHEKLKRFFHHCCQLNLLPPKW